jgi:hypothetical protein
MKKLSKLLGQLWEIDPNKSLWTLSTKAWSAIRDQIGKDKAPLDQFLHIICPYLNLPSPEVYLEGQGWKLEIDQEGLPVLSRESTTHTSASLSNGLADMTLSVDDIIGICQSMGYAQGYVANYNTTSSTFLGRLAHNTSDNTTPQPAYTPRLRPVQEMRVAARNKRRTRRQFVRQSGAASALREQIINTHGVNTDNIYPAGEPGETVVEPPQLYDDVASLLIDYMSQAETEGVSGLKDDIAANIMTDTDDPNIFNDWLCFESDYPS